MVGILSLLLPIDKIYVKIQYQRLGGLIDLTCMCLPLATRLKKRMRLQNNMKDFLSHTVKKDRLSVTKLEF